jgi:transcription elongation factor Elf1
MPRRKSFRSISKGRQAKIPNVFICPSCGEHSISISIDRNKIIEFKNEDDMMIKGFIASVKCSNFKCVINDKSKKDYPTFQRLSQTYNIPRLSEKVDVFGLFVDEYYALIKQDKSKGQKLKDMDLGFLELP